MTDAPLLTLVTRLGRRYHWTRAETQQVALLLCRAVLHLDRELPPPTCTSCRTQLADTDTRCTHCGADQVPF